MHAQTYYIHSHSQPAGQADRQTYTHKHTDTEEKKIKDTQETSIMVYKHSCNHWHFVGGGRRIGPGPVTKQNNQLNKNNPNTIFFRA